MRARRLWASTGLAAAALLAGGAAGAATFTFTGTVTSCTLTCDSFAFLGTGGTIDGFLELNDAAIADGTWVGGDVTNLSFVVGDPALPPAGPSVPPNPATDNPFTIDPTADRGGLIVANGQNITNPRGTFGPPTVIVSSGTTNGSTSFDGLMDIWLTTTVLAGNGAIVKLNLTAGTFEVKIFEGLIFVAGGTIGLVAQVDTDGDGAADSADNCKLVDNNGQPNTGTAQNDTDGDGIGNMCDADFTQSCTVDFVDLGELKSVFFQAGDLEENMNGTGAVDFLDLGLFKADFFKNYTTSNPSGIPNVCAP